jgi:hypothetical protein
MNKSLTSLLILLTLSGCNFIEPYYVNSEDSIKKVENQNFKILFSALKFYLKFQHQPKFGLMSYEAKEIWNKYSHIYRQPFASRDWALI